MELRESRVVDERAERAESAERAERAVLQSYRDRYARELLESVTPFWMRHSLDREHGGQFTCLDRDGQVYDTRKYIWLQGRAVWMFSRLYRTVAPEREWLDAAALVERFVRQHARDARGRYYFSVTREGRPAAFQRKPYAAVFAMAGLLEYARATDDERMLAEAIELFSRIEEWIRDPALLDRPPLDASPAPVISKLSDVMVTIQLLLELIDATAEPRQNWDDRLRELTAAAMRHCDTSRHVFLEHAALDDGIRQDQQGGSLFDTPDGRLLNPGHSIEMAWFLLHVLRRHPDTALQARVLTVLESTLEFGWDREHGGLFYFMDVEGRPPLPLESTMKLWWPHTEAIYAVILAYATTREAKWLDWLSRLDAYTFEHFSDAAGQGEWFGYCDRFGQPTNTCKGNNYKGFYHVPRCLLFSVQTLDSLLA
jgi:N-acylglucosamine 2-epimerase